jgi:hypothetical protein
MNVDLVSSMFRVDGASWECLLSRAIASHMRRSLEAGSEVHEDTAGRLEDCLLDTLCSMRALDASRAGRGGVGEASEEAAASMLRLIHHLCALVQNSLGS